MADRPHVVFVVGPTAIGKTALGIRLAKALKSEIVSADSRQFYREMPIGTAQPTAEERAEVKHHFIDFLDVEARYSAGHFHRDVQAFLTSYFQDHQTVVIVGGSGLYLNTLLEGFDDLPHDPLLRQQLKHRLETEGLEALQQELKQRDPEHYASMDVHNPQRLVRALEVCILSGKPYSSLRAGKDHRSSGLSASYRTTWVGIQADREMLYERINQRVDLMVASGLEEEARKLYPKRHLNALNTVGYKEWFAHFEGHYSREECIEKIKQHTRNFAKRQLTWFRSQEHITWFDRSAGDAAESYLLEQNSHHEGL